MRRVPFAPRLTVEATAGRGARHVRSLSGTSDWRRSVLDRMGTSVVLAVGTRWLPRAPRPWPWPAISPRDLGPRLGLPGLRVLGAAVPRQHGRDRLSVLAELPAVDASHSTSQRLAVIKLGRPDDGLATEATALRLLTERPLPTIATPRVIAAGTLPDGAGAPLEYVVTEPLGVGRQRPAIDEPLSTFEEDLADRLAALPRPPGTPGGHVPVHGDLAPWNLRRTDRGLALFDWERAGWGPPGSDLAHYRSACAALRAGFGSRFRSRR